MQAENTENLQTFALRLRGLSERRRKRQAQVARELGIPPSRVGNWFQGLNRPKTGEAERLAELLGVSVSFLLWGEDDGTSAGAVMEDLAAFDAGFIKPRFVPVVSWTHAGDAVAYEELPLDQQERVATFVADPKALAVTVEGESMLPDFKPGDRVILSPSREPRNGRPVVAKLADDGVVLRLFHRINEFTVRLSSLRPDVYPTLDYKPEDLQWVWPVEELSRRI